MYWEISKQQGVLDRIMVIVNDNTLPNELKLLANNVESLIARCRPTDEVESALQKVENEVSEYKINYQHDKTS